MAYEDAVPGTQIVLPFPLVGELSSAKLSLALSILVLNKEIEDGTVGGTTMQKILSLV